MRGLSAGTIDQARAIVGLARQILRQPTSQQARIALARGIMLCAKAIEDHETRDGPPGWPDNRTPPPAPRRPGPGQPEGNP